MRIFKTKWFRRFARHNRIDDALLLEAVVRAERGLVDADLGGGMIKQRVARRGSGRSGGFRTLVIYRAGNVSIFVFGFAKNDLANIEDSEMASLKDLAKLFLSYDDEALDMACDHGELWEIGDDEKV